MCATIVLMKQATTPLAAYRAEAKLTLEQLGEKLGKVNKSTVLRWETGDVLIPVDKAKEIHEATKIPLHELRPDVWEAA